MNVGNKIKTWQKAGLISQSQEKDILEYEKKQTTPYLFFGFLALSAFCIGLGVVAIVAANWSAIPSVVKLVIDFLMLALSAGGVFYSYQRSKTSLFEAFLFLFAILLMASIGLIAQIYQLQPDGAAAYLLWSLLIFPLLFFVRGQLLSLIFMPILWVSFWEYVVTQKIGYDFLLMMTENWLYAIPLLWLFLWGVAYQILDVFFAKYAVGLRKAIAVWLSLGTGVLIFVMDKGYRFGVWPMSELGTFQTSESFAISLTFAMMLAVVSLYLGYKSGQKHLMPYMMALMLLGGVVNLQFLLSFLALIGIGVFAYRANHQRLLSFVLLLVGVRLFLLYLDVFTSLMNTGLSLVVSGFALLIIVFGWAKLTVFFKRRLAR